MKFNYNEIHVSSFIKGIAHLTGIEEVKLKNYANRNNLFNVLEHPGTISPNKQQLEKIHVLNEFIATYRVLKLQENENKLIFKTHDDAGKYFVSLLSGIRDREKFLAAFMDAGNHVIEVKTFSEGSVAEAPIYPRAILKAALDCDCLAVLFAHNHPGGNLYPSFQDRNLTQNLVSIFAPLQIKVLDHIIVAGNNFYSMLEKGTMPQQSDMVSYDSVFLDKLAAEKDISDSSLDFSEYEDAALQDFNTENQEDEWER